MMRLEITFHWLWLAVIGGLLVWLRAIWWFLS